MLDAATTTCIMYHAYNYIINIMGKTYRNVNAGSNSTNYHSPHIRGFAREKKTYSHKQTRNNNRNCDDETFQQNNWLNPEMNMNSHWASQYYGKLGNIPNLPHANLDEYCKWRKNDKNILETINREITNSDTNDYSGSYLASTKKQIERRGKMGLFKGHRV